MHSFQTCEKCGIDLGRVVDYFLVKVNIINIVLIVSFQDSLNLLLSRCSRHGHSLFILLCH